MKDTITLPALIQQLQSKFKANVNPEQFIEAFTATVLEGLGKDGNVTIKGFGKFIILPHDNENGEEHISKDDIRFVPDNELAETINQPFAFFDAVELDDDVTDEVLENSGEDNSAEEKTEIENQPETITGNDSQDENVTAEAEQTVKNTPAETKPANEETSNTANVVISETETSKQEEVKTETITETENEETTIAVTPQPFTQETTVVEEKTPVNTPDYGNSTSEADKADENTVIAEENGEDEGSDKSWIWLIAFFIIGLAIGWSVPTFITNSGTPEEIVLHDTIYIEKTVKQEVAADTIKKEAPATQQSKIITDTVRTNRFLTQMARKYYGNPEFWAYIYIENQDKLKNPNTIAPGTVVVIPPAEKYGIDSKSKQSVNTATQKCREILNKYEKK